MTTNTQKIAGLWSYPTVIAANKFVYKSLSDWSCNTAVGCTHGCRFCYVPSVSLNKMRGPMADLGVEDTDRDWGNYVFARPWDEKKFLQSLASAERSTKLSRDGNRAVMFCSTTDAYQVAKHPDAATRKEIQAALDHSVMRALELILKASTLNVRILTRSPLARRDFDLMKQFGNRLMFGMSLPTLRNDLAKVYEPEAPAPSQRLACLQQAKAAGLNVFVAMAPTYPECDEADMTATMKAIADLDPWTVFHEPINIRAENVERIRLNGVAAGVQVNTGVFNNPTTWRRYAVGQLKAVELIALRTALPSGHVVKESLLKRLHLWPDASLGTDIALREFNEPEFLPWLKSKWNRVSEWPF